MKNHKEIAQDAKSIRKALKQSLTRADMEGVKKALHGFHAFSSLALLSEKNQIPLLSKAKSPEFLINLFKYIENLIQNEKNTGVVEYCDYHTHPLLHFSPDADYILKHKIYLKKISKEHQNLYSDLFNGHLEEFKKILFKATLDTFSIHMENVRPQIQALNVLWGEKNSINYASQTVLKTHNMELIDFIWEKMEKSNYEKKSKDYFFCNLIGHSRFPDDEAFLENVWTHYSLQVKEAFDFLKSKDKFWIDPVPMPFWDIEHNDTYHPQKIDWLDSHEIGYRANHYKHFERLLPYMNYQTFHDYIEKDKKILIPHIQKLLHKNIKNWSTEIYNLDKIMENKRITIHEKINYNLSSFQKELLVEHLDKSLNDKEDTKKPKI